MGRPALEVADIFRLHGLAWRQAQLGHLSLAQLKVMSAIEQCRSAALGGHVLRCDGCGSNEVSYNSCRNRHCPKCQSSAAKRWLDARATDLLPVEYYHVVFTLPAPIADIAYQNKAVMYELLFDMAAETLLADKAFDADERVIEPLLARGKSFVIPPKSNRKVQRDFDKDAYKARHLIENFFCKLKQYRAIATRYDKTARNFLAAIHLAAAIIWLN